jgi:hypothetical protein
MKRCYRKKGELGKMMVSTPIKSRAVDVWTATGVVERGKCRVVPKSTARLRVRGGTVPGLAGSEATDFFDKKKPGGQPGLGVRYDFIFWDIHHHKDRK